MLWRILMTANTGRHGTNLKPLIRIRDRTANGKLQVGRCPENSAALVTTIRFARIPKPGKDARHSLASDQPHLGSTCEVSDRRFFNHIGRDGLSTLTLRKPPSTAANTTEGKNIWVGNISEKDSESLDSQHGKYLQETDTQEESCGIFRLTNTQHTDVTFLDVLNLAIGGWFISSGSWGSITAKH